jgi:AraC family transcriptional regulator
MHSMATRHVPATISSDTHRVPRLQGRDSHCEPSLLCESQTAAWVGFQVGLYRAVSHEAAVQGEHANLAMILKGRTRGVLKSRGDHCDISPGPDSIGLFAPCLDISQSRWHCEPGAERLTIELNLSTLEATGDLDAMLPRRRTLRQNLTLCDPHLASLMRLVADEVRQGSPHGALYATSLSLALAAYLFDEHSGGGRAARPERGQLTVAQRARVMELVQQRLADELSLDDLAAAAGLSRFHFLRRFKNTLGVTPLRFVLEQRTAAARRLLEDTSLPLAEVASAVGFSSQSHLCAAMRRFAGLTPGQWRRAARNGT